MTLANILWSYPQSSCNCYQCDKNEYTSPEGQPTNFSVESCVVPQKFECVDRSLIRKSVEPTDSNDDNDKYTFLNHLDMSSQNSGFFKVKCNKESYCPRETYVSHDPRLLDPVRNSLLKLDRPPMSGSLPLKEVYSEKLKNYGQNSFGYSDINSGQIQYYIDHSIEDAFFKPVYDIPSDVDSVLYKDPMDNMKPQYNRHHNIIDNIQNLPEPGNIYGCLSFIQDTSEQREQIISLQQLKNNSQKWSSRWKNDE